MANPRADIKYLLRQYYDGLYYGDTELLASLFHSEAVYHTSSASPPLHYNLRDYLWVVDNRKSPVDLGDLYAYEIEDIRFAGADTALATFKCAMMGKQFTDFLSLAHDGANWRIIAKVFHYDLIEET